MYELRNMAAVDTATFLWTKRSFPIFHLWIKGEEKNKTILKSLLQVGGGSGGGGGEKREELRRSSMVWEARGKERDRKTESVYRERKWYHLVSMVFLITLIPSALTIRRIDLMSTFVEGVYERFHVFTRVFICWDVKKVYFRNYTGLRSNFVTWLGIRK